MALLPKVIRIKYCVWHPSLKHLNVTALLRRLHSHRYEETEKTGESRRLERERNRIETQTQDAERLKEVSEQVNHMKPPLEREVG